ncbi:MAG: dephospho-CoA kinase [Rhizobium sp.]|nr:dephospho-CoA kinase [Rhizobium sp.]
MIIIGLTGSIGMGKTTTAALFAAEGIPVYDSDRVVHDLYRGEAVALVEAAFPGTVIKGQVDRQKLSETLAKNPANFKRLEGIVHPLVRMREREFLAEQQQQGQPIVLLDIPLLFETGADGRVSVIVVVSCDQEIQEKRVLTRPGMSKEKLQLILARQMPDSEKRARADFVVDTGVSIDDAKRQVKSILATLRNHRLSTEMTDHA